MKLIFTHSQKIALLICLSSLMLGLPFLQYTYGFLVVIGVLTYTLLIVLLKNSKDYSVKKKIFLAWIPGFISLLIVVGWLPFADMAQWGGLPVLVKLSIVLFSYVGFAAILSTQYLLIGLLVFYLNVDFKKLSVFLIYPSIWVVAEYSRSVLFSILLYGKGGSLGAYWNFGSLGLAFSTTWIGYASRLLGLWGMSFLTVVVALGILWVYWRRYIYSLVVLFVVVGLAVIGWVGWYTINSYKQVGYIQYQYQIQKDNTTEWLQAARLKIDRKSTLSDLVVLPEYSGVLDPDVLSRDEASNLLSTILRPDGSVVASESIRLDGSNEKKNVLLLANARAEVIDAYEKYFLIPTGEYVPWLFEIILKTLHQDAALQSQLDHYTVKKGNPTNQVFIYNGLKIASQVCSGAIGPELFRHQVRVGGQIMTNSASIVTLSNSKTYHQQSLQAAHFMAVANARPYVQSAFGTHSFILNKDGTILHLSDDFDFHYISQEVGIPSARTIYTIFGEWVVLFSFLTIISIGAFVVRNKMQANE